MPGMNKVSTVTFAFAILLAVSGLSVSISSGQGARPLFEASIIACGPTVNCGGFSQNVATMAPVSGRVTVFSNGAMNVVLRCNCTSQTFEVFFGSFTSDVFQGAKIGNMTTDSSGQFSGPIIDNSGSSITLSTGPHSGQFIFNVPGVRSEFITGFIV